MKRTITIILAACLLLALCACGGGSGGNWEVADKLDEFGDPTGSQYIQAFFPAEPGEGATADGKLTARVTYDPDTEEVTLKLLKEDGTSAMSFAGKEDSIAVLIGTITLKVKSSDGATAQFGPDDLTLNGELTFQDMDLMEPVRAGDSEVRCIVSFGAEQYTFTINGSGFGDSMDKWMDAKYGPAYAAAEEKLANGDYDGAIEVFETLGDYKDSAARMEEAVEAKTEAENAAAYAAAEELLTAGDYDEAIAAFQALGDYSDSADRMKEATEAKNTLRPTRMRRRC